MKAKIPGERKLAEHGKYLCLKCDNHFLYAGGSMVCPRCGNRNGPELVPYYVENDLVEEQMYTESDFGEGD